jgi:hypothetical protein
MEGVRSGRRSSSATAKPVLLRVVTEGNLVVTALLMSKIHKYGG